jgi:hypothetical protein
MKNGSKIIAVLAGLLIWSLATSCFAVGYYSTQEQTAGSDMIKSASEFSVRPIDFSAINAKDLGYTNNEEWKTDLTPVPGVFADAFPVLLKEANIGNKKVAIVKRDEKVSKGIIVEVAVTKIILNWSYMTARPDELVCNVIFINAANGQKLFSGIVNVNSRSGNPYAQAWGASFSNRLQAAAYNIAWVLTKVMVEGKIEPADY